MAVVVNIEQSPHQFFSRTLQIVLLSTPTYDEFGRRDRDEIGTYVVHVSGGTYPPTPVEFTHRYGDDVFTLIHEAITALGVPVDGAEGRR